MALVKDAATIFLRFFGSYIAIGALQGGREITRLLEGFLEGSLMEVLLGRALRRRLVRVSVGTGVVTNGGVEGT